MFQWFQTFYILCGKEMNDIKKKKKNLCMLETCPGR